VSDALFEDTGGFGAPVYSQHCVLSLTGESVPLYFVSLEKHRLKVHLPLPETRNSKLETLNPKLETLTLNHHQPCEVAQIVGWNIYLARPMKKRGW